MLETLRTEKAGIQLSLVGFEDLATIEHRAGKYHPLCSELVYIRVHVTNLTNSAFVFTLDVDVEPREHVIFDGVLYDMPIGRLHAKESREVEVAVCFLCHGRFEVFASARVPDIASSAGSARLIAMVDVNA
jgi:trafficking protein particle complex subunit 9